MFLPVYNSEKIIKIHQDFPDHKCSACHLFMVHSVNFGTGPDLASWLLELDHNTGSINFLKFSKSNSNRLWGIFYTFPGTGEGLNCTSPFYF